MRRKNALVIGIANQDSISAGIAKELQDTLPLGRLSDTSGPRIYRQYFSLTSS